MQNILVRLTNPEELNIDDESWIGSLASVGALIGTFASQVSTRYISARHGLILSSVGSLMGWSLIFVASQENNIIQQTKLSINTLFYLKILYLLR